MIDIHHLDVKAFPMIHPIRKLANSPRMAALALVFSCAPALAAPAPADEMRAEMLAALHKWAAPAFVLDKDLTLDPALRAAADKMSVEHLARIDKLLPAWLDEERERQSAGGKTPPTHELYDAVLARLLNEMSLWQLEPGDAAYENATLDVLKTSPRVCKLSGDYRFTDFASRMLRIQAMPEAQRDAALATERRLLAHWGQPRAALAPWPDPLPQDAALALLRQGPADAEHPARLALPPRLASAVLGLRKDYAGMHPVDRCVLQQWWLRESLRQGVAPAAALNAFRYGTMLSAVDRIGKRYDVPAANAKPDPAAKPPYPGIATRYHVAGATTVSVQLDPDGKPRQAGVVERKVEVRGIRGVRPVAFENVFDAVSVDYAMHGARQYAKPAGGAPARFTLVWQFDGSAKPADATKGSKP